MLFTIYVQAIINENDLDANGCLSFDEFLISMAAKIKILSEEEHRSLCPNSITLIRCGFTGTTIPQQQIEVMELGAYSQLHRNNLLYLKLTFPVLVIPVTHAQLKKRVQENLRKIM